MTTKYVSMKDLENFFWDKALKSRGDETVKYINLKDEIITLPSLESKINTLQRYNIRDEWNMYEHYEGEYIRYEDLVKLLS